MKLSELIAQLKELPQDEEIFVVYGDDILGDYRYGNPTVSKASALKHVSKKSGAMLYYCTISNYIPNDAEEVTIWEIS